MESMRSFALEQPRTLADATALLAKEPGARVLAGGTDLVPNLRRRIEHPPLLIDLGHLDDLGRIEWTSGVMLGARVTLSRIADDADIARSYRALAEAAASVAGPGHRAAAT